MRGNNSSSTNSETKINATIKGSSIPITPKIEKNSYDEPSISDSPRSALFSREDQIEIQKNRKKLELEVMVLEQKYKSLKTEHDELNQKILKRGELLFIQSQTRNIISHNHSSNLNSLMQEYIDVKREVVSLNAMLSVLDQKLNEESGRRNEILEEYANLQHNLDFSSLMPQRPTMISSASFTVFKDTEFERNIQTLNDMHNQIIDAEISRIPPELHAQAAVEFSKSIDVNCRQRSIGISKIRSDILDLQKALVSQDLSIRKNTNDINEEKKRINDIKESSDKEAYRCISKLDIDKLSFSEQIKGFDDEIKLMKNKLSLYASDFDTIQTEIAKISTNLREIIQLPVADHINCDLNDFKQKKMSLSEEIKNIEADISNIKKEAVKKEKYLRREISSLHKMAKQNKQEDNCFSFSSDISNQISINNDLMIKIDQSLSDFDSQIL